MEEQQYIKKVCMLGDPGVGKTSLVKRFVYDMFDDEYLHTIGTKISKKVLVYPETGIKLTLVIWDIMGQRYQRVLDTYFKGARGALVVCDLTKLESLESIPSWINLLYKSAGPMPVILVANKSDLSNKKQFGEEQIAFLAKKFNAKYVMTSAKLGIGVEQTFRHLGLATIYGKHVLI
ncbi:MAG: Rab family GTPase [Thermoplasmata archaeon]